jgi:hypothetical protein
MLDMTRSKRVATRAVEQGAYTHGAKRVPMWGEDDVRVCHSFYVIAITASSLILR